MVGGDARRRVIGDALIVTEMKSPPFERRHQFVDLVAAHAERRAVKPRGTDPVVESMARGCRKPGARVARHFAESRRTGDVEPRRECHSARVPERPRRSRRRAHTACTTSLSPTCVQFIVMDQANRRGPRRSMRWQKTCPRARANDGDLHTGSISRSGPEGAVRSLAQRRKCTEFHDVPDRGGQLRVTHEIRAPIRAKDAARKTARTSGMGHGHSGPLRHSSPTSRRQRPACADPSAPRAYAARPLRRACARSSNSSALASVVISITRFQKSSWYSPDRLGFVDVREAVLVIPQRAWRARRRVGATIAHVGAE